MTTCAFDGKTFACDSRIAGSFIDTKKHKKIFRVRVNGLRLVVAICGDYAECLKFVHWLKKHGPDKTDVKLGLHEDFQALVYDTESGTLVEYTNTLFPTPTGVPTAIGSGCDFAMGAMMAGATAGEAVKIAIKLDKESSAPVHKIHVVKKRKRRKT